MVTQAGLRKIEFMYMCECVDAMWSWI